MLIAELFHPLAARLTLGLFALIWGAAVAAGLFADPEWLSFVKEVAVWALFLLIPVAAITALTGLVLSRARPGPIADRKQRRLRQITALGILVVLPTMLALDALVQQGITGLPLLIGEGIELAAGLVVLVLMGISVRDGIQARREAAANPATPPHVEA